MSQIPDKCPNCGHTFSKLLRPTVRMQLSAMLLFCVGVAFVFPWAALLYLLARISPVLLIPRHPVAWVVALCIIVAPGLVVGAFALRMRRVIIVQCHKCKWKQKLLY